MKTPVGFKYIHCHKYIPLENRFFIDDELFMDFKNWILDLRYSAIFFNG